MCNVCAVTLTCDLTGMAGVLFGAARDDGAAADDGGGTAMLMLPLLSLCVAMPDSSDVESCT